MSLKFIGCIAAMIALLGLPAATRAETAGTILNLNHDMELGLPGHQGVPGYRLVVNQVQRQETDRAPDRLYLPMTVQDAKVGQCLQIPGYMGVMNYQIELPDLYIRQDCEIEISFDARVGPDESGKDHSASAYHVDFRAMPNPAAGESFYPMLNNFSFKPATEWQHFSVRYPVKARSNFFAVWIMGNAANGESAQNALYLDQVTVRKIEKQTAVASQAAVIPDRLEPVYTHDDKVAMTIRAAIAAADEQVESVVAIRSDLDNALAGSYPVRLKRTAMLTDSRSVYQGQLTAPALSYGSFHSDVTVGGQPLSVLGGDFAVLHPAVQHPRFSPGWKIGYNTQYIPEGRTAPPRDAGDYRWVKTGSFERSFRIAQQAGMSLQRLWGHWRFLEPSEENWTTDAIASALKMDRKYNLDVIYVVGGNMTVQGDKQWFEKQFTRGRNQWPHYLARYYHDEGTRGSINPPPELFAKFLDFSIRNWGDQIHIWEVFNEPGIGGFPADTYLGYLKQTYQQVKQHHPDDIVLGNGVTGDFGMNVVKWCQTLNAADPNYPNYLDGVAFHPYAVALDYQNGRYGLYTQCIADISSLLKIKKPLWNTECFFLPNTRQPQIPWDYNLYQCGANAIQRHVLESLLHNVAGMTALYEDSFVKRSAPVTVPVLSQEAASTNALSWLLKDMRKLEPLALNKFMRSGIFSNAAGDKALGFIYDMRPAGSLWHLPAAPGGVQVLDLFGNPVPAGIKTLQLSYEPYYLAGAPEEIRTFMNSATIQPRHTLEITGRIFQDQLYLEARNVSGVDDYQATVTIDPQKGVALPKQMELSFAPGRERDTVTVLRAIREGFDPKVPMVWHTAAGESSVPEQVRLLPVSGGYDIPMTQEKPLNLNLNLASKAAVWADENALHVTVSVADEQIQAATLDDLWNGDALEIFIDTHPLEKLDMPDLSQGTQNLDVWQYIFAAKPSGNQTRERVVNHARQPVVTQAQHAVELVKGGYTLAATIPWADILSPGNIGGVIGMDLDVDHANDGKVVKESLGAKPGKSFQERLHYPLFRIPAAVIRKHRALLLTAGDMQTAAATGQLRIDLASADDRIALAFAGGSEGISGAPAEWRKENRDRRLVIVTPVSSRWQRFSFSFMPAESGKIAINLMGNQDSRGSTWCYVDDMDVQGASALKNGNFEQQGAAGRLAAWSVLNQPILLRDAAAAAEGDFCVMTSHDNRFMQEIVVEKDKKVTVSFQARAAGRQRIFQMP